MAQTACGFVYMLPYAIYQELIEKIAKNTYFIEIVQFSDQLKTSRKLNSYMYEFSCLKAAKQAYD